MVRGAAGGLANDEDTSSAAIIAQQRIFQLKKERDKKVKNTVAKAVSDLDRLERRICEEREERRRARKQNKANMLREIIKSMERRSALEEDMVAVVREMDSVMAETEHVTAEAYRLQEREVCGMLEVGAGAGTGTGTGARGAG